MIDFLIKLFTKQPPIFTGALADPRKKEEKLNDIHFQDIVATASPVSWVTKTSYRTFPEYNQLQSYTCGANALAKALGIAYSTRYGEYVPFSRANIYQRRANRPQAGMFMGDMFNIASLGITLEQLTPEPFKTDTELENITIEQFKKDVGSIFKISGGVYLPCNIEQIASTIQTTGKGIILMTYFLSNEWSQEYPTMQNRLLGFSDMASLRHFVVAVDFTLINGKKYLVIEDSAWFGGLNRRFLSEEWVTNRVVMAGYPMNFKFQTTDSKRSYDGITYISAQQCLQDAGFFPLNVSFFENWGAVSRASALKFQARYGLTQTGLLDQATKNKLHELYP
jgi:hypothetical protein